METVTTCNLGEHKNCKITKSTYLKKDGPLAVMIYTESGEPLIRVSTNIVGSSEYLPKDQFHVPVWNIPVRFQELLLASGFFEVVDRVGVQTGFVKSPIWRLKL